MLLPSFPDLSVPGCESFTDRLRNDSFPSSSPNGEMFTDLSVPGCESFPGKHRNDSFPSSSPSGEMKQMGG